MQFKLLGPLEVADGERPVTVGAGKRRALLAVLLLHANEVVPAERLIDELWGERPPATVAKSLHVYVSQLRKELGHGNGAAETVLRTHGNGYVIVVGPDDVDCRCFERLLADARHAAEAGDPGRASARLGEALAMWRGPPLADFAYEPFAQREIARLEELRLDAVEARIDADLELGRHRELAGELEALVDEHPLRERLRGQLMLALYRSGRQAEALQTYRDGRSRLDAELGLEPSPALRELEVAILEHSPALAPPKPATTPPPPPPPPAAPPASEVVPPAPPERRRRPRLRLLVLAGAALVLIAAAGLAAYSESDDAPRSQPSPPLDIARNSVAAVDAVGGDVRFAAPLPGRPTGLVAAGDTAWAATVNSPALVGIDLAGRRIVRTATLTFSPGAVALGEGAAWVADGRRGLVASIVPGYTEVSDPIRFRRPRARAGTVSAAVAAGGVWIADGSSRLARVDAATREVNALDAGRPLSGVAAGGGAVWAISAEPPSVVRIDPVARSITDRLAIVSRGGDTAPNPVGIAADDGSVWVLNMNTATVTRIDPVARGVIATIPIGVDRVPNSIASDGARAWVANEDGTLSRIDPGSDEAGSVWVGESLRQVAASGSRLWVATAALDQQLPGGDG